MNDVSRLLTEMMQSYFEDAEVDRAPGNAMRSTPFSIPQIRNLETPVQPISKSEWELGKAPRCLKKTFKFSNASSMAAFLQELLAHEIETGHHGRLTCEFPHVQVEIRTHDLDDVTELDQEYAKICDHIYRDVKDYQGHQEVGFHDEHGW